MRFRRMTKQALEIEEAPTVQRLAASTLGRLSPENLILAGLVTPRVYVDPTRDLLQRKREDRQKKHEEIARAMESAEPQDLDYTKLRLGGVDVIDDVLWRRRTNAPWYKRIGGRVWHNPRTSVVSKLLGTAGVPIADLISTLRRSSHYNHYTDVANVMADEPSISSHELGHAIDFNRLYGIGRAKREPGIRGRLTHELRGLAREAYGQFYGLGRTSPIPLLRWTTLPAESRANLLSWEALKKGLKGQPKKLEEIENRRAAVLTPAFMSYVGSAFSPWTMLGLMAAGRLEGLAYPERKKQMEQKAKEEKQKRKEKQQRKEKQRVGQPALAPA